jgi:hypothetical protein
MFAVMSRTWTQQVQHSERWLLILWHLQGKQTHAAVVHTGTHYTYILDVYGLCSNMYAAQL